MYIGGIIQSSSWDYRIQGNKPSWRAVICDSGLRLANGQDTTSTFNLGGSNTSATAGSEAGARKSLIRIFEMFFKVKFEVVEDTA